MKKLTRNDLRYVAMSGALLAISFCGSNVLAIAGWLAAFAALAVLQ